VSGRPGLARGGALAAALAVVVLGLGPGTRLDAADSRPHKATASSLPSATWSEAFAGDTDSVLFLAADGGVWRAPFDLSSRDTAWQAPGHEHVVRLVVSPDGRRAAWLARDQDQDSTSLWLADFGPNGHAPELQARYEGLRPTRYNSHIFESDQPTTNDPVIRGARLVSPSIMQLRRTCNPIAWSARGEALVYGDGDGTVQAMPDGSGVLRLSHAVPISLSSLEPAPLMLMNAVVPVERHTEEDWLLGYTARGSWRLYGAGGLTANKRLASSVTRVWWIDGHRVLAVRSDDAAVHAEIEADGAILWIGAVPRQDALWWVSDRDVFRHAADGERREMHASTSIAAMLEALGKPAVAAVTKDSLLWLAPPDSGAAGLPLPPFVPDQLVVGRDGDVLVARQGSGLHHTLQLALCPRGAREFAVLDAPYPGDAVLAAAPGAAHALVVAAAPRTPTAIAVLDFASRKWAEVQNPGVIGWEPLVAR
jgi:hypothetical protein